MILHNIAYRPGPIIESAAALYPKVFRHRDLYALHIVAIPERFHKRVGEAKDKDVIDRQLAQVMIDAKNVFLLEMAEQKPIQMLRRFKIKSERLFHDDSGTGRTTATVLQLFQHNFEKCWRNGEIVCRASCPLQFSAKLLKRSRIDSPVFCETVMSPRPKLLQIPAGFGNANDRNIEMPAFDHGLQGGKYLLVREIASGSKENKRVGMRV